LLYIIHPRLGGSVLLAFDVRGLLRGVLAV